MHVKDWGSASGFVGIEAGGTRSIRLKTQLNAGAIMRLDADSFSFYDATTPYAKYVELTRTGATYSTDVTISRTSAANLILTVSEAAGTPLVGFENSGDANYAYSIFRHDDGGMSFVQYTGATVGAGTATTWMKYSTNGPLAISAGNDLNLTAVDDINLTMGDQFKIAIGAINIWVDADNIRYVKGLYSAPSAEDGFRIKFTDSGGITNDVGIGQLDVNSLWLNVATSGNLRFYGGTDGELLRIVSNATLANATFDWYGGTATFASRLVVPAPAAPTLMTFGDGGDVITLGWTASTSDGVDAYEVYASIGDALNYKHVGTVQDDLSGLISFTHTGYDRYTTIYYKVFATRLGVHSAALSGSYAQTVDVADVQNVVLSADTESYYVSYDIPDDNRLSHIEIKMDKHAVSGSLLEGNAVTVYTGLDNQFVYRIPAADLDLYHKFWIYAIART